jgi:DNA-binding MarR family transcriptional regulator
MAPRVGAPLLPRDRPRRPGCEQSRAESGMDRGIEESLSSCNDLYNKRIKYAIIYFRMNYNEMGKGQGAFLLAQLGAHAASQFAERLGVLELTPADAGILRLLRITAGLSQQDLAAKLQIHPSRLVAILDNLEKRQFVERRANPDDRRLYSLHLTKDGGKVLERIGKVAREHQDALLSALNGEERDELTTLLLRIADQQGLVRGVHPGYRRMGQPKRPEDRNPVWTRE